MLFFLKLTREKRRRRRKRGRGFSLSLTKRKEKKKEKITLPARHQPTQPCLPSSLPRRSSSPTRSRSPIPRGPRRPCAPPSTWPGRSGRARGRRPWPLRGRLFFFWFFFFSRGRGREGRKVRWSFWCAKAVVAIHRCSHFSVFNSFSRFFFDALGKRTSRTKVRARSSFRKRGLKEEREAKKKKKLHGEFGSSSHRPRRPERFSPKTHRPRSRVGTRKRRRGSQLREHPRRAGRRGGARAFLEGRRREGRRKRDKARERAQVISLSAHFSFSPSREEARRPSIRFCRLFLVPIRL